MDFNFSSQGRKNTQSNEERERLLKVIKVENEVLTKLAEEFYSTVNRDDQTCIKYSKNIIEIVDRVLCAGDWESSLFLRNMIKPIKQIREQAEEILKNLGENLVEMEQEGLPSDDELLVYVSLFQAKGDSLVYWELQLRSIESHLVSRPVYKQESAIDRALRSNVNSMNSAYAILKILKSDIDCDVNSEEQRFDRFGQKLVLLKDGRVSSDNIVGFVHEKLYYYYRQGKLVLRKEGN